jgi:hypothetical protein
LVAGTLVADSMMRMSSNGRLDRDDVVDEQKSIAVTFTRCHDFGFRDFVRTQKCNDRRYVNLAGLSKSLEFETITSIQKALLTPD